jgi:hypothetical protein
MTKTFNEIISSPEFQAETPETKLAIRDDYFNKVITPQAKANGDDLNAIKADFESKYSFNAPPQSNNIDEGYNALAGAADGLTAGIVQLPGIKKDSASYQGSRGATETGVRLAPELLNLIPGIGTLAARIATPAVNAAYGGTQSITDDVHANKPVNFFKALGLAAIDGATAVIPGAAATKATKPLLKTAIKTASGSTVNSGW